VAAARRIDQLRSDPNALAGLAVTTFQHVSHPELPCDFPYIRHRTAEGEAGLARDDKKPSETCQRRDDVVGDGVEPFPRFFNTAS
jgi:hypothetical protein